MAPERRKEWNVILELARPSLAKIMAKFFLSLESVSGHHLVLTLTWNKGELSEPGVMAKMALRALTGQRGDLPRAGTLMILTVSLFWRVLLHLMRI